MFSGANPAVRYIFICLKKAKKDATTIREKKQKPIEFRLAFVFTMFSIFSFWLPETIHYSKSNDNPAN